MSLTEKYLGYINDHDPSSVFINLPLYTERINTEFVLGFNLAITCFYHNPYT